jgi:hypothetical protein
MYWIKIWRWWSPQNKVFVPLSQKLQAKETSDKEVGLRQHQTAWDNRMSVSQTNTIHSNNTLSVCLSAQHKTGRYMEGRFINVWHIISRFVYSAVFKNIKIITHFKWKLLKFKLFCWLKFLKFYFKFLKKNCTILV